MRVSELVWRNAREHNYTDTLLKQMNKLKKLTISGCANREALRAILDGSEGSAAGRTPRSRLEFINIESNKLHRLKLEKMYPSAVRVSPAILLPLVAEIINSS